MVDAENPQEESPLEEAPELDVPNGNNEEAYQSDTDSTVEATMKLAEMSEQRLSAKLKAESNFTKELEKFHVEQQKILEAAEARQPQSCSMCLCIVNSKKDIQSMKKHSCCFKCYTTTEKHKTNVAKDALEAEGFAKISTMDLSDYEDWLFGDEMGQRSLARIMAKLQAEGYNYKPWQVSIGAAAWSKENYNDTDLVDTRHIAERVKIAEVLNFVPTDTDGIQQVIASVKRAEEVMAANDIQASNFPWLIIGGTSLVAVLIPLVLSRR